MPLPEAKRQLGTRFIEGFLQTLAGRALGVMLPMLGPERALPRVPRFMAMGAPALTGAAREEAPRSWRVEVRAPSANPDFDAGLVEAGLRRTGSAVRATVLECGQDRYVLGVSW